MVAISSVGVGYIGGLTTPQVKLAFDRLNVETIPVIEALEEIRYGGMRLVSSASEYGFIRAEKAAAIANNEIILEMDETEEKAEEAELTEAGVNRLKTSIKSYTLLINQFSPGKTTFLNNIKSSAARLQSIALHIIEMKKQGKSAKKCYWLKKILKK